MRKTTTNRRIYTAICLILISSILFQVSHSAVVNHGKSTKKTTVMKRANLICLQNGYRYLGGFSFKPTQQPHVFTGSGTLHYKKGNTIYIVPAKPFHPVVK